MKKFRFIPLIIIFVLMCGCVRINEVDSKSFVTAIGFDKGENYNLRFTFVFTSPSKETAKNGKNNDETIVIEAPSLYSAIEQINNFKSQVIALTHTQTLIFSEELAREGLSEYIYMLVRSNYFRPNTYLCVTDKSSMELLEKINPVQTYHLEKYFQLLFNKMTSGKKGDLYLYDSYFGLHRAGQASVLPYCAIKNITIKEDAEEASENASEEPTESETIPGHFVENTDDFAINLVAGHTVSKSENTAEVQGIAVLKGGCMTSVMGRAEAICLQMITDSMPDNYLTLSDPYNPKRMITCYVSLAAATKIETKCGSTPEISLKINLEGDFVEVGKDDFYVKHPHLFEAYFEEKAKESIMRFLVKLQELNCDICAFSEAAKAEFLTVDEWEKYGWDKKFPTAKFNVEVNLTIRTYGELSQEGGRK